MNKMANFKRFNFTP